MCYTDWTSTQSNLLSSSATWWNTRISLRPLELLSHHSMWSKYVQTYSSRWSSRCSISYSSTKMKLQHSLDLGRLGSSFVLVCQHKLHIAVLAQQLDSLVLQPEGMKRFNQTDTCSASRAESSASIPPWRTTDWTTVHTAGSHSHMNKVI